MKLSKLFLIISVVSLAFSFTDAGSSLAWGLVRPLGAVCLILFFMFNLLEDEMAKYDEECRQHPAYKSLAAGTKPRPGADHHKSPPLTASHSH